jgi:phage antirepressor YoqD-like protein
MSDLSIIQGQALTMSSREIAELTGSTHDNVLKTIRALAERGIVSGNDTPYVHPQNGQTYREFRLNYRDTMVVVSGYSVDLRARIIDRWQQLEAQIAQPAIPQTLPEALRLAADLAEQKAQAVAALAVAAPKAEALDRIAMADGSSCITDAAKVLQVRPKYLFAWLQQHQWIYRRPGGSGWLAYQSRIQQGYLEHKVTTVERGDGTEKVIESVRVTRKGLTRLAQLIGDSSEEQALAA